MIPTARPSPRGRLALITAVLGALLIASVPLATASAAPPSGALAFTVQPGDAAGAGVPLSRQPTVTASGRRGPLAGLPVTLSIARRTGTSGARLACTGGTTAVTNALGSVTFAGCQIDRAGIGYRLVARVGGEDEDVDSATSDPLNVGVAAVRLALLAWPASAVAGQTFPTAPRVAIVDTFGNVLSGISASITLSIGANPGGGVLTCPGGNPIATFNGIAQFGACQISQPGAGYTLVATAAGIFPATVIAAVTSPAFTVGPAVRLAFLAWPASAFAGQTFPTAPRVAIVDTLGNVLAGISAAITLSIGANPGGGVLTCPGGNPIATFNGIAQFGACQISQPGAGYTLVATAAGIFPATVIAAVTSPAFTVAAAVQPQIGLTASRSVIAWGGSVNLYVQFRASGANRTVLVQSSPNGSTWATIASLATDALGGAALGWNPRTNAWYRAVFAGSPDLLAGTSAIVRVVVRQLITIGPANIGVVTTQAGRAISFTVSVTPRRLDNAPTRVTFVAYRRDNGVWLRMTAANAWTDPSGRAAWTWRPSQSGSWYIRAVADPTLFNANSFWTPLERYLVK